MLTPSVIPSKEIVSLAFEKGVSHLCEWWPIRSSEKCEERGARSARD